MQLVSKSMFYFWDLDLLKQALEAIDIPCVVMGARLYVYDDNRQVATVHCSKGLTLATGVSQRLSGQIRHVYGKYLLGKLGKENETE